MVAARTCLAGASQAPIINASAAVQVHTAVANAECLRLHGGAWASLIRPSLLYRLFQLTIQVGGRWGLRAGEGAAGCCDPERTL